MSAPDPDAGRPLAAARRAAAFVAAAGDALLSPWGSVLAGDAAPEVAAEAIVKHQQPDGGFGDVASTRRVLALLEDLGARGGPLREGACAWLASVQAEDGHWGDGDAALFETGVLVGLQARSPTASTPALHAAADWLAGRFTPDVVKGFRWPPLAGYAAAFSNHAHDAADEILQWCGRELERGFRAGRFDAVLCGRVLLWCDALSVPGSPLSSHELLPLLLEQQEPDGGWPAPEPVRVQRSWDGLVALCRFAGVALPARELAG